MTIRIKNGPPRPLTEAERLGRQQAASLRFRAGDISLPRAPWIKDQRQEDVDAQCE